YGVFNLRNHQVCMPPDPEAPPSHENVALAYPPPNPRPFSAPAVTRAELPKPPTDPAAPSGANGHGGPGQPTASPPDMAPLGRAPHGAHRGATLSPVSQVRALSAFGAPAPTTADRFPARRTGRNRRACALQPSPPIDRPPVALVPDPDAPSGGRYHPPRRC